MVKKSKAELMITILNIKGAWAYATVIIVFLKLDLFPLFENKILPKTYMVLMFKAIRSSNLCQCTSALTILHVCAKKCMKANNHWNLILKH